MQTITAFGGRAPIGGVHLAGFGPLETAVRSEVLRVGAEAENVTALKGEFAHTVASPC